MDERVVVRGGGDSRSLFRLGPSRPLGTIVLILLLLAASGLGFGALLGEDDRVDAFVPEEGPSRVQSEGGDGALLASAAVSEEPAIGSTVRFGPKSEGAFVLPDGWRIVSRSEDGVVVAGGEGVRVHARILRLSAETPASQLVEDVSADLLASTVAAHVRTSRVVEPQPFASLVTQSALGYSALRTDAQGVTSVGGNVFAFVRDDGVALVVNVEVNPAARWDAKQQAWFPVWLSVVSNFAGASPLG